MSRQQGTDDAYSSTHWAIAPAAVSGNTCPHCGVRLVGLKQFFCPTCGGRLLLKRIEDPPGTNSSIRRENAPEIMAGVFAHDVLCWECGYNLRDLPDLRCPECGTTYAVVKWDLWRPPPRRRPLPMLPLVWNVLVHPGHFWSRKVVFKADGPTPQQILLLVLVPTLIITGCLWHSAEGWKQEPAMVRMVPVLVSLVLLVFGMGHVQVSGLSMGVAKAMVVVAYSALWLVPLSAVAAAWLVVWRDSPAGWWIGAALFTTMYVRWEISLYYGGCAAGKSPLCGVCCALTNPWLWLTMLVLLVVVSAE